MVQLWEMGVSIMVNLRICIAGYTDTVSVYVNDDLLMMSSLIMDAKYTYSVSQAFVKLELQNVQKFLINSGKKVALNWLSCISGISDFTLERQC